jgi:Putative zinc ribbon domain
MEAYTICQSCGMPMDREELMGIENDLSKSTIYCSDCYRNGEFTHPEMTLQAMKDHVKVKLQKDKASEKTISLSLNRISYLSRWMGIRAIHHCREWH